MASATGPFALNPKSRETGGNLALRQQLLVRQNLELLGQAAELLARLGNDTYAAENPAIAPHRAGGHMRHVLEYYECFLDGLPQDRVDYTQRRRDLSLELSCVAALTKIHVLRQRLAGNAGLRRDSILWVRMEQAEECPLADSWLTSSVGRELENLLSHTTHHFALAALTLKLNGFQPPRDFGMAPSTLRHLAANGLRKT